MSFTSTLLLGNTENANALIGTPIRVDEGYGHTGRVYTVAVHVSNFLGAVHIEAALVGDPTPDDWFNVIAPFRFPRPDTVLQNLGESAVVGFTVSGNYAWIRARMERDGLPEIPTGIPNPYGFVDRVLLNASY
ncbi:MAG: hypothetical protein EOP83_25860 [Verrucomicrobiaceae bacterium]|nr:MAG: hypothetical protein EOP83_25860 [Verrucomicrobiaceae bacterium]